MGQEKISGLQRDRLRLAGVEVPLIPGLFPPRSLDALECMAALCGVSIPETLRNMLAKHGADPDVLLEIGWEHTERQPDNYQDKYRLFAIS